MSLARIGLSNLYASTTRTLVDAIDTRTASRASIIIRALGGGNRFGPGGAVVKMDTEANPPAGPPPSSIKPRVKGLFEGDEARGGQSLRPRAAAPPKPSVSCWSSATVFPSEPVFVGRPGASAEDDGVLLFLGYDTLRRESFMGVLDAADMSELARVHSGSRCCVSFHGQWIPA